MEPDIKRLEPTNERKCCLTPGFESGLRPSKTMQTAATNATAITPPMPTITVDFELVILFKPIRTKGE